MLVLVQTVGAGLVGASTSAFFEDGDVAVSYEQAGNIMIAGLALQVSSHLGVSEYQLMARSSLGSCSSPSSSSPWFGLIDSKT